MFAQSEEGKGEKDTAGKDHQAIDDNGQEASFRRPSGHEEYGIRGWNEASSAGRRGGSHVVVTEWSWLIGLLGNPHTAIQRLFRSVW